MSEINAAKRCVAVLVAIGLAGMLCGCTQVAKTNNTLTPISPQSSSATYGDGDYEHDEYKDSGLRNDAYGKSTPADVLWRFEDANNSRDLQALMDCYDPEYMAASKAFGESLGGALSEAFFGFSIDVNTEKLMPFFSKAYQKYVQSDDVYATVELVEISTEYKDENNAVVKYIERVISSDGSIMSESEAELPMIRVDGVWYISMIDSLLSLFSNLN